MKANFDTPMELSPSGRMLEVCGPLEWAAGELAVAITVTIVQDGLAVVGSSPRPFTPDDDEWMFFLRAPGGQKFQLGAALGIARGDIATTQIPTTFDWQEDGLELRERDRSETRRPIP
jgi:hypothetical protein